MKTIILEIPETDEEFNSPLTRAIQKKIQALEAIQEARQKIENYFTPTFFDRLALDDTVLLQSKRRDWYLIKKKKSLKLCDETETPLNGMKARQRLELAEDLFVLAREIRKPEFIQNLLAQIYS